MTEPYFKYTLTETIYIKKKKGKQKDAFALFKVGMPLKAEFPIPTFLKEYIRVTYVEPLDYTKDTVDFLVELESKEGLEQIPLTCYMTQDGEITDIVVNKESRTEFVVAWEKLISIGTEEGSQYNVWYKANSETTLIYRDGNYYERPKPMAAQLVTDNYPTFLNVLIPEHLVKMDSCYAYRVSWSSTPLKADLNKGFWIKYAENDFNYLAMDTESAESYYVTDEQDTMLYCSLSDYYKRVCELNNI
jgi:hypothetical protein